MVNITEMKGVITFHYYHQCIMYECILDLRKAILIKYHHSFLYYTDFSGTINNSLYYITHKENNKQKKEDCPRVSRVFCLKKRCTIPSLVCCMAIIRSLSACMSIDRTPYIYRYTSMCGRMMQLDTYLVAFMSNGTHTSCPSLDMT